jgi:hypothetical protein
MPILVMTSAGVLVQPQQAHIDVVIDYWDGFQLQLSVFGETVRDLMLAGF